MDYIYKELLMNDITLAKMIGMKTGKLEAKIGRKISRRSLLSSLGFLAVSLVLYSQKEEMERLEKELKASKEPSTMTEGNEA